MDVYDKIADQIQRGLVIGADATKLVLMGIQAGYIIKGMEQEPEKKAG